MFIYFNRLETDSFPQNANIPLSSVCSTLQAEYPSLNQVRVILLIWVTMMRVLWAPCMNHT